MYVVETNVKEKNGTRTREFAAGDRSTPDSIWSEFEITSKEKIDARTAKVTVKNGKKIVVRDRELQVHGLPAHIRRLLESIVDGSAKNADDAPLPVKTK